LVFVWWNSRGRNWICFGFDGVGVNMTEQNQIEIIRKQHDFILKQDKLIKELFEMSIEHNESWASLCKRWNLIWFIILLLINIFWSVLLMVAQNG